MEICVIVPSHIPCITRSKLLIRCLNSLINQTIKIPIYLSISFETELDKILFEKLIYKTDLLNKKLLCVIYQDQPTSQFRHIENVISNIKNTYNYVMFCDDDDTYEIGRVENFVYALMNGRCVTNENKIFVGAYEASVYDGDKNAIGFFHHSYRMHEYWSYCVNMEFIVNFINILKINNYDYAIDNKMCDVLFTTYLRSLDNSHIFCKLNEKLYNYNRDDKNSITNIIETENNKVMSKKRVCHNNFKKHIQFLNYHIEQRIERIKQNIFLYVGNKIYLTLDDVLKFHLKENYKYKSLLSQTILSKINSEYNNMRNLCDILYQTKSFQEKAAEDELLGK